MTPVKRTIFSALTVLVWLFASFFNCGICHASDDTQSSKADHSCCDDNKSSGNTDNHSRQADGDPCSNCVSCISNVPTEQAKITTPQLTSIDASLSLLAVVNVFSLFDFTSVSGYQQIATTTPPKRSLALD